MNGIFIFLVILSCIFYFIFKSIYLPRIKGAFGELKVNTKLGSLGEGYELLSDITIHNSKGLTSQIDHIVISEYGIFVIETKNYKGWIFGNDYSENWTQVNYRKKNTFRNPVKQNWSHIYALKSLLEKYQNIKYFSIVVFSGSSILKKIQSSTPVIYGSELIKTIRSLSYEKCLTRTEVENIKSFIQSSEISTDGYREEHIQNIKNNIKEYEYKKEHLLCPKCNGTLVMRKGKYGSFYGCSNYPKCKYIQK